MGHEPELALLDAAAARAGDAACVEAGDSWSGLMERAAGHLARAVVRTAGHGYGLRVTLLVGKGNNGGDGWAAARRLRDEHGVHAIVVAPDGVDTDVSDETATNRAAWLASGGRTSAGTADLDAALARCDVAVDCLLGTGVSGAPRGAAGEATAALHRARDAGVRVVACDVPSGVSSDDGSASPAAVRADVTVTFGACKRGLLLHPGAAHAGRVTVGSLGPAYDGWVRATALSAPTSGTPRWSALTPVGAAPPVLAPDADKRARGVVLGVGGAVGTSGAAALLADGALRAGAGLVTMLVPGPVGVEVAARADPGVMVRGVAAETGGAIAADARGELPALEARPGQPDVVVAGPGLGYGAGAAEVVAHLRAHAPRVVLDADALNVHLDDPAALADHAGDLVLTPHARELARIGGGADGDDAWAHRVERLPELAGRYAATIVAKGPGTIVAAPDGRVWVTPLRTPALGSGGTGDALSGIVGAAIARADDVPLAVARAVWWHALAGVRAGWASADRATATDVLAALPGVLADLASAARGTPHEPVPGALPWDVWREPVA